MSRLPNKTDVVRRLFAFSGNQCAFPGCTHNLINEDGKFIGQICHIEAANEKGERYNPDQTDEERRSFENLMLFCYEHHIVTNDINEYPVARLKEMKHQHEIQFVNAPYKIPPQFEAEVLTKLEGKLDELYSITEETKTISLETNAMVKQMFGMMMSNDDQKIYIAQLDAIKELKKNNKHETAIELLLKYKKENWNKITPELKYKVVANLGIAYLDLAQNQNAIDELKQLENIDYHNEDVWAYLAMAYSLEQNDEKFQHAFEKGLNLNKNNVNLWLAFINIKSNQLKFEELFDSIPVDIREKPEILYSLGGILIKHNRTKEGVDFYLRSLNLIDAKDKRALDLKASIASKSLETFINPYKLVYQNYTAEEVETIKHCVELLTEAWDDVKDTELAKARSATILNRGVAFKILGRFDESLNDFQKAYELSKSPQAFKNLALEYIDSGRLKLAEDVISDYLKNCTIDENEDFDTNVIKARLLNAQEMPQDVAEVLKPYWDKNQKNETASRALNFVISSFFENGKPEESLPYIDVLIERFPDDISGYIAKADYYKHTGDIEGATLALDSAFEKVSNNAIPFEIEMLASRYLDLKKWKKAGILFEKIADKTVYNKLSRGLVYAYFYQGNIKAALDLSLALLQSNPSAPFLVEIICNCYEETNNYQKAIESIENFLKVAPPNSTDFFLLKQASFYYYLKDWDKVKNAIVKIKNSLSLPLDSIFKLCYFLLKTGEVQKALDIAFDARTQHYDNVKAHEKFLQVLTQSDREYEAFMFPEFVREESAVIVKDRSGKENTFLITSKDAKGVSVIKPDHTFAKMLLGKKLGDYVTFSKTHGINQSFQIVGILDKYVFASRESLALFETKFAGESKIFVMHAGEGPETLDELFQFIRTTSEENKNFFKDLNDYYNRRIFFVSILAQLTGHNMIKQWFNLITSDDLFFFSNTLDEIPVMSDALALNKPVVVDLTGLLTLFFLYKESLLLNHISNQFIISQSTFDELNDFYEELCGPMSKGFMSVGFENGRFTRSEMKSEDIEKQRQILKAIIDWCKADNRIKASSRLLDIPREERERQYKLLGEVSIENIWLAQEYNAVIYSDDDNYKNYCRSQYGLGCCSSYSLAIMLFRAEKISKDTIEEFLYRLIQANYVYIPVSTDMLWKAYEAAKFEVKKPFVTAAKGLMIMKPAFAANSLVGFIKKLYLNPGLHSVREQIVLYALNELRGNNQFDLVIAHGRLEIENQFRLLPSEKQSLLSLLNAF